MTTVTPSPSVHDIIRRLNNAVSASSRIIRYPMVPREAHDCTVVDIDGNAYLDFNSGWTVAAVGYSNPEVVSAIEDELKRNLGVTSLSYPSETTVKFAERLIKITPGDYAKKVWLGLSGSDACGAAYKLFSLATGKSRVFSFYGNMHGSDLAGIAMSGLPKAAKFPVPSLVTKVPYAYCYRCPFKLEYPSCTVYCASDFIEDHVFKYVHPAEDTSFMIVEPIQSDSGDVIPPPGYFEKLKKTCDKFGILFVSDEVKIGCGRTGKMFGVQHSPTVTPDAVVLGKGLGSGFPVGALVARRELMDTGFVPTTLGSSVIGAAAGLATLNVLEKRNLTENAAKVGEYMKGRLEELKERHEVIGDVRGKGLILGVEFVKDRKTKEPAKLEIAKTVFRSWQLGLLVGYLGVRSNVMEIIPPLTITRDQADKGIGILDQALKDVGRGLVADSMVNDYI